MNNARPTPLAAPLDGRLLVEASAGTGKTYTLTTLAARLVVEAGHRIENLLIVTFTVAATGELRTRIWQTLYAARDAVRDATAAANDQARELAAHWRRAGIADAEAEARLTARHPRLRTAPTSPRSTASASARWRNSHSTPGSRSCLP